MRGQDLLLIIGVFGGAFLLMGVVFIEIPTRREMRKLRGMAHSGAPLPHEPVEEIR